MAEKKQGKQTKPTLRQKLIERLDRNQLPKSTRLRYRVAGGMPSERIDQTFSLSGDGEVRVSTRDALRSAKLERSSGKLSQEETQDLFRQVEAGLDELVPREQARFLPDTPLGMVTLEVAGEKQTYFFAIEEERLKPREFALASKLEAVSRRIRDISRQFQRQKGGSDA